MYISIFSLSKHNGQQNKAHFLFFFECQKENRKKTIPHPKTTIENFFSFSVKCFVARLYCLMNTNMFSPSIYRFAASNALLRIYYNTYANVNSILWNEKPKTKYESLLMNKSWQKNVLRWPSIFFCLSLKEILILLCTLSSIRWKHSTWQKKRKRNGVKE